MKVGEHQCQQLSAGIDIWKEDRVWELRIYRLKPDAPKQFQTSDWRTHFTTEPTMKLTISFCPFCGTKLENAYEFLRPTA